MTETLSHGTTVDTDHLGPPGTIGRVAPGYDVELRRRDGSLCDPGEQGHLFIRGVSSEPGYCKVYLPDFKVVRSVYVVEELPRSTLEKIAKNVLRERLPGIEQ